MTTRDPVTSFGLRCACDLAMHRLMRPVMEEGASAYYAGLTPRDNEYPEGTDDYLAWMWGWTQEHEANK